MTPAEHLAAAFADLAELPRIRQELERAVAALTAQATAGAMLAALEDGLHPDHAYSSEQAARFLGVKPASLRAIDKVRLPRVRSGQFLGIDVMAFRGDVTHEEAAAYKAAKVAGVRQILARAA